MQEKVLDFSVMVSLSTSIITLFLGRKSYNAIEPGFSLFFFALFVLLR